MDFKIVVEPQETQKYANKFGQDKILTLPFSNLGLGSIPARNWCWEDAKKNGDFLMIKGSNSTGLNQITKYVGSKP